MAPTDNQPGMSEANSRTPEQQVAVEKCPDCNGRGFHEIEAICMGCDGMDETHSHPARRETCATCRGAGTLSGLALAVRKARGGPPSTDTAKGIRMTENACAHRFDFVPFNGIVCTRCDTPATTETTPPNHMHSWPAERFGEVCPGCGLIWTSERSLPR